MTRDEILDEYEALWRQAALRDQRQFFGQAAWGRVRAPRGAEGPEACAYLVAPRDLQDGGESARVRWRCRDDGFKATTLAEVQIHLNNAHHWTWDQLANKFRDALTDGERLAAGT